MDSYCILSTPPPQLAALWRAYCIGIDSAWDEGQGLAATGGEWLRGQLCDSTPAPCAAAAALAEGALGQPLPVSWKASCAGLGC